MRLRNLLLILITFVIIIIETILNSNVLFIENLLNAESIILWNNINMKSDPQKQKLLYADYVKYVTFYRINKFYFCGQNFESNLSSSI
jgi:hypothetical protein